MNIAQLSDKQISRLRNGHSVRVKEGTGHQDIALGEMNMKKCIKCFKKVHNKKLSSKLVIANLYL